MIGTGGTDIALQDTFDRVIDAAATLQTDQADATTESRWVVGLCRGRHQAAMARDLQRRGQTRPATRQEKGKAANERKAAGRLAEGQVVTNGKQALAQLAVAYPDRINPHL